MMAQRIILSLAAAGVTAALMVPGRAQWPSSSPIQDRWPTHPQQAVPWPDPPGTKPAAKPQAQGAPKAAPRDVEGLTPGQILRTQEAVEAEERAAAAKRAAKRTAKPNAEATATVNDDVHHAQPRAAHHTVNCRGAFARNSSHAQLVKVFGAGNVVFSNVAGPDHTKLKASVLFPKDPARRLEVLWQNNERRAQISVIAINGRSAWHAPRGLHLGLGVTAMEKLNHKPFKLRGFERNGSMVLDWQNGALALLPGNCKVNVRWVMSSHAPPGARKRLAGKADLTSNAADVRAARPIAVEILLGY
jgi:hypothetical protein